MPCCLLAAVDLPWLELELNFTLHAICASASIHTALSFIAVGCPLSQEAPQAAEVYPTSSAVNLGA